MVKDRPRTKPASGADDEEGLWRAVHASLASDEPRLVLADALQQRGDPQGELIVVQCELARLPADDSRNAALRKRERALLRDPAIKDKERTIRMTYPIEVGWRRGLIGAVEISASWLKDRGQQLLREIPSIEELDVGGCIVCYGEAWPELERVHTLRIGLARSEHVEHLDLEVLSGVRSLQIYHTPLDRTIQPITRWQHLRPRLLDLRKDNIRAAGGRALAAAALDLERLDLRQNHLDAETCDALRRVYGERVILDAPGAVSTRRGRGRARSATS